MNKMDNIYLRPQITNQTRAEYLATLAEDRLDAEQLVNFFIGQITNEYALVQACQMYIEKFLETHSVNEVNL